MVLGRADWVIKRMEAKHEYRFEQNIQQRKKEVLRVKQEKRYVIGILEKSTAYRVGYFFRRGGGLSRQRDDELAFAFGGSDFRIEHNRASGVLEVNKAADGRDWVQLD
jgi:hypothetical protein